jgi:hypothetical protein
MTYDQIRRSILKRLGSWTTTRISYDWMTTTSFAPPANVPFVRPALFINDADHRSATRSGLAEVRGSLVTEIRFPKTWAGGLSIGATVKEWENLWRRKRDGQIWYREPESTQPLFQPDDRHYMLMSTVPFIGLIRPLPGQLEGFERMHFSQTNSFSVLDAIYHSSTGWALANGGSTGTMADAIVSAVDGDDFAAIHGGFLEIATTYTAGDTLWLSTAADGSLTATEPTASPKQRAGKVIDTATILINLEQAST